MEHEGFAASGPALLGGGVQLLLKQQQQQQQQHHWLLLLLLLLEFEPARAADWPGEPVASQSQ
jgi:hypothetical protein